MRLAIVRLIAIGVVLSLLVPAAAVAAPNRGIQSVSASIGGNLCGGFSVLAATDWQRRRADTVTLTLVTGSNDVLDTETLTLDKPAASGSWSATLSGSTSYPATLTVRATLLLKGAVVSQLSTRSLTCESPV